MPRLGVSGGAPSRTILRPHTQEKQMNLEKERNKSLNNDAYIMDDSYSDMEKILEKSKNLAEKNKEEKQ